MVKIIKGYFRWCNENPLFFLHRIQFDLKVYKIWRYYCIWPKIFWKKNEKGKMCWHHHFYLNFKFLETAFKFRETAEPSKMERGKSVEFIWAAEVTLSWTWQNRTRLQCDQKGEKTVYEKCKMANKIFSYKRAFWGGTLKTLMLFYFFISTQFGHTVV